MITINLTLAQVQTLISLLDQGVRATGLKGCMEITPVAQIIELAVQKYHKEQEEAKNASNAPNS